jgi:phage tail sheath protein FI
MGFDGLVHTGAAGSNVANIDAVTVAEIKAILEAAWTNGSGVTVTSDSGKVKVSTVATGAVTLAIVAATANSVVGFTVGTYSGSTAAPEDTLTLEGKWAGTYANALTIKVSAATSGTSSEFNLYVMSGANVIETFANATMDSTASRYVVDLVNSENIGSLYFAATDEGATGSVLARRPANTSGAIVAGGDDGLTSLDDNDFIGSEAGGTGLYAFDAVQGITLLSCPDATASAVQVAMLDYCGDKREGLVFALLDAPSAQSATDIVAHRATLNTSTHQENGALYWPRVKIVNPNKAFFGSSDTITVCPSGDIAGRITTNDSSLSEGPFAQPAGTVYGKPRGWVGLETEEAKLRSKLNLVFPQRVNPISYLESYGYFVDGARTLKGDGNFPSVGERRGVSHIERVLNEGLQWTRHRNNTPALRSEVETQVYALLHGWMTNGAFASTVPDTAFFVDVSDALNPPSSVQAGKLVLRVGLATNTPAEFIIIKVTKDTRALSEELFG